MIRSPVALRWSALFALAATACEAIAGLSGTREQARALGEEPGCAGVGSIADNCSSAGGGSAGTAGSSAGNGNGAGLESTPQAGEAGTEAMAGAAGRAPVGLGCNEGEGPALAPKSCDDQTAECNGESACTSSCVPGGPFLMGRGENEDAYLGGDDEKPEHSVTLSPYWLDKYEVTVGRFRRFVESYDGTKPARNAGAHPKVPASGWKSEWDQYLPDDRAGLEARLISSDPSCNPGYRTWTSARGNSECLPINCVDWYVSFAFCVWDGGRLPSEAEWEFAAAGGGLNRLFPWGSDPPDNSRTVLGCLASGSSDCSPADIRDVGSRPLGNGLWLQADLAGSMVERTRDVFDPEFYTDKSSGGSDIINLSFDATGKSGTMRGGGFFSNAADVRAATRSSGPRAGRADDVGVRCARNP